MKIMINTAVFENEIKNGKTQIECLEKFLTTNIISNILAIEVRLEFFPENLEELHSEIKKIVSFTNEHELELFISIPQPLFLNKKINSKAIEAIEMMSSYPFTGFKVSCGELFNLKNEDFLYLKNLCNGHDYKITIENPPNDFGNIQNVKSTLKLLKDNNVDIGYTFDSGNWYWINESPTVAYELLSADTTVFHLKSIYERTTILLEDERNQTWRQMIKMTKEDILIALEYDIPMGKIAKEIDALLN